MTTKTAKIAAEQVKNHPSTAFIRIKQTDLEINSVVELGASLGLNSVLVRRDGVNSVKIGEFKGNFTIPPFKVHNLIKN